MQTSVRIVTHLCVLYATIHFICTALSHHHRPASAGAVRATHPSTNQRQFNLRLLILTVVFVHIVLHNRSRPPEERLVNKQVLNSSKEVGGGCKGWRTPEIISSPAWSASSGCMRCYCDLTSIEGARGSVRRQQGAAMPGSRAQQCRQRHAIDNLLLSSAPLLTHCPLPLTSNLNQQQTLQT